MEATIGGGTRGGLFLFVFPIVAVGVRACQQYIYTYIAS